MSLYDLLSIFNKFKSNFFHINHVIVKITSLILNVYLFYCSNFIRMINNFLHNKHFIIYYFSSVNTYEYL